MEPPVLDVHPFHGRRAAGKRWRKHPLSRLMPFHVYVTLATEWRLARVRLRGRAVRRRFAGAGELLVNIGAGPHGKPGWVNLDAAPAAEVNCVFDCRRELPFADGAVRAIFSEHFVEHLDYTEEVPLFLRECARVLRPGGVIRLVVPDAERYLHAYCQGDWSGLARLRTLDAEHRDPWLGGRYRTRMELINAVFRQGEQHKYAYDYETLALALAQAGFDDIGRCEYGHSRLAQLALDQAARAPESLYVEAQKP